MNFLTRNKDTEFHFMVDIETLDTGSNAAITEIGAYGVDTFGSNSFFRADCIDPSGTASMETMKWRQENNLPWATNPKVNYDIIQALTSFFGWIEQVAEGRTPILWCKGTDFDAVILTNAAKRNGFASVPWKYNDINDVRTLLRLWPQFKVPRENVTHNGLEDAIMQWTYLEKIADHVASLESAIAERNYHLGKNPNE